MMYGLTIEEREELEELKKVLFQGETLVVFDDEHDHEKVQRYNYLIKKKMELMQAGMN